MNARAQGTQTALYVADRMLLKKLEENFLKYFFNYLLVYMAIRPSNEDFRLVF